MSAVPSRRRRLLIGFAIVVSLALSACTGQRDPTKYSDGVRENWMEGCTAPAGDKAEGLSSKTCGCIYDHVEEKMDFSDFKDANSDRRENPTVLKGPGWDEAYKACGVGPGTGDKSSATSESSERTTTTTSD
ncbi:MAG: hypothetical protein KDB02_13770 [Acidimicrobiales bacterium]|nr:hypothetical protein [Acidimicrobiales bacterium]